MSPKARELRLPPRREGGKANWFYWTVEQTQQRVFLGCILPNRNSDPIRG